VVLIRAGLVAVRARLHDSPTADRVWAALPIYASAEVWDGALHFEACVETTDESGATSRVAVGEVGLCIGRARVVIACGAMAPSGPGDMPLATPVSILARVLDDVRLLASVRPGERVAVLLGES
jgi:hypothetical protein